MKKLLLAILLLPNLLFAWDMNQGGGTIYMHQDPSGAEAVTYPDGSQGFITKDPSGNMRLDNQTPAGWNNPNNRF